MKRLLTIFALAASAFAQDVPARPPLSATKATWVAYATKLETVVAGLTAEADSLKVDSAKIASILDHVVAIEAKVTTAPGPTVPPPSADVAPVITQHPASVTAAPGSTVVLSAAATGTPAPTLQWWRNGISFAHWTGPTLTLEGVSSNDLGSYTAVATNTAGSATSNPAVVSFGTVPTPPIVTPPNPDDAFAGSNVTFEATADGNPLPSFTWKLNGTLIDGATSARLELLAVTAAQSGQYVAVATNSEGSAESPPVTLNVIPLP
jgi:hypothetical protein